MVFRQSASREKGFSLLELIIVLVIIGVIVGTITIAIIDTREDKLNFEARRLAARLSLAIDESILMDQELGLEVETDRYRFLTLGEVHWQEITAEDDLHLGEQKLPEEMEIQLSVDNLFSLFNQENNLNKLFQEVDENNQEEDEADPNALLRPQIYLMSSGEINPFVLLIGYEGDEPVYFQIQGTFDGKITLEGPIRESMNYTLGRITSQAFGK